MRITVLGGTGHIGSFLVPRLVAGDHMVSVLSRFEREPYVARDEWREVRRVKVDRASAEQDGTWSATLQAEKADAVIDLICFTEASARLLVEAIRGRTQHLLQCGSIAAYGPSLVVPTSEDMPRRPSTPYGEQKAAIETFLLGQSREGGVPATVVHPGHIVGPGWVPINPQGNGNMAVYETIARGEALALPNAGLETLHHVHADDVAGIFEAALTSADKAIGESFNAVSSRAMTFRGYAEALYAWFGHEPHLHYVPWSELRSQMSESDAASTWSYHLSHSPHASVAKARDILGFTPRYSGLEAIQESLTWLIEAGRLRRR